VRSFLSLGGTSSGAGRGTLTVNGGLVASRSGSIGTAAGTLGTVTVTSGTWLNNASGIGGANAANLTIGGSGTGSVTINNGGYVVVSGSLSRGDNGTLTLNQGGTLQIGGISNAANANRFLVASTGTTGSGTSGVLVGDLNYAGTLKFAQNSNGASATSTYNGTLSGAGDLVKTGTGTLSLGGNNSYSGGTTLVEGALSLNSANAIGTSGTISFGGGTLQATANNTADYSSRFSTAANQQYSVDSNGETLTLASNLTSSGGSFAKVGSGTATLTGANTFTSGTVGAGVLIGSASNLATSGTFGVGPTTELRFNQTTDESWNGKLHGSGTASKYGAGTLTLTGSGGGTTGTLSIAEGKVVGTTDNLKSNIVNNSQLTFDQTTSGTYTPNISGTGSLGVVGSGTITLSGTNNISGIATVSGGRLVATKSAAMPSQVVNNAAVGFTNSTSGTYSGTISGTGLLAKLGAGDMTLTGANTYSGGTQISAGSLIGDTTSLQGNIAASGGNLKFNQATSGTFSDVLSGVGNFFKLGAGDLTLAGTNTNAGPWTVSDGRLIGTSRSVRGDITNSAAVVFDQTTSGTYSGNMSGAGTLTKLGSGEVVLSGSNSYTGATTVSNGSLVVNGSVANTALTVQSGATLGGSGTIGTGSGAVVLIQSGGNLSPGNSPGMLTVNGNLTLSLGSTFDCEVFSGSVLADSMDINGVLSLNDTALSLTNLGTYVANEKFTLFAYESLIGTFDGLADDTTFTAAGGEWLINYNDTTGGLNTAAVGTSYITLTAVPEPSALLIGALGLFGLLRRRR
jgi:autotransporter-associated beta strand protein